MKNAVKLITGIALAAALCVQLFAVETEDAKAITKRSFDAMKLSGLESTSTLIIKDASGNQRVRKFQSSSKEFKDDGVKKSLMRFVEPADVKGTGFLTFEYTAGDKDNDMWIYMPALRKVRRVVSGEKAKSFMGSEFTNSDITEPKLEEFTYKISAVEKIGDIDCWKIETTPVSQAIIDEYGYSKRISWVSKGDYITRKTEYYDTEGKLVKTLVTNKIMTLDKEKGLFQASDIVMTNVQNGRTSEFITDKCVINPDIKDDIFTTDNLKK
jgi:outer membrane lipoprotein-sorting protein